MNKTKKDKYFRKNKGNKRSKHKTRKEQRGGEPGNTAVARGISNHTVIGTGAPITQTKSTLSSLTGEGKVVQPVKPLTRDELRAKQRAEEAAEKEREAAKAAAAAAAPAPAAAPAAAPTRAPPPAPVESATGTASTGAATGAATAASSLGNFKPTTGLGFEFGGVIGSPPPPAPVDAADAADAAPVAAPVPVANPLPTPVATPVAAPVPVPVAGVAEVKTAASQSDPEKTSFTDADIETMKANILENQKLQQKGNTYIDGIMKGIMGKFLFLFPNGRKKYMEGQMSNIASENTENTSNKVSQILKTYDENMNMLIEMKQKYLRVKQKLMSLDMDNIEVNKKMIDVTKKIHDVDADILENIVGTNNLVLQVQAPQIGIEKEVISFPSRGNGNIQPYYDNQRERSFTDKVKDKYNTFKEERSARKVAKQQESTDKTGTAVSPSNPAEKPQSPPAEKPSLFQRGKQFLTRKNTPKAENPPSPPAEKPLSPTAGKPSLLQRGRQFLTRKNPPSTAVAVGGGNANNKTRKNRQYIHEIKENREHLFTKEMEIIKSIRNFKHGHNHDNNEMGKDKKENIEKKFIKTITRS